MSSHSSWNETETCRGGCFINKVAYRKFLNIHANTACSMREKNVTWGKTFIEGRCHYGGFDNLIHIFLLTILPWINITKITRHAVKSVYIVMRFFVGKVILFKKKYDLKNCWLCGPANKTILWICWNSYPLIRLSLDPMVGSYLGSYYSEIEISHPSIHNCFYGRKMDFKIKSEVRYTWTCFLFSDDYLSRVRLIYVYSRNTWIILKLITLI